MKHPSLLSFARPFAAVLLVVLSASTQASADDVKPECATLLEKASGFARYDVTYPQARVDLRECSAGRCTGNRALVDVCKATLARLDDTVPVFVKVKADRALSGGAHILIDGEPAQASPLSTNTGYRVKAGHHTIVCKAEGFADGRREVDVDANSDDASRTYMVCLETLPPALPTPRPAVHAVPAVPTTPAPSPAPSPAVDAEEAAPRRSGIPYRPVGGVFGGVGLVGLAVGAGLGVLAIQKKDAAGCDASSRCPTDVQTNTLLAAKGAGTASTIFVVAGGAFLVGGIFLWVLKPSEKTVSVAPTFGPGVGGLVAKGTF